jgi:hypothetical protein
MAGVLASDWQGGQVILVVIGFDHKEITMSNDQNDGPVERYLAAIEGATIGGCDVLSSDVLLDATVPNWRFTRRGANAVRAELANWYSAAGRFEDLRRTPLPEGELVEFTLGWEEGGVPHAVHQAHVVEVADGLIASDRVWCGGRWPAGLLAEMAEAADATS